MMLKFITIGLALFAPTMYGLSTCYPASKYLRMNYCMYVCMYEMGKFGCSVLPANELMYAFFLLEECGRLILVMYSVMSL